MEKGNFQGNTVQFDAADRALHQQKSLILKPFLDVLKKLLLQMMAAVIEEKNSQCVELCSFVTSANENVAVVTPDGEWHEPGAVGWFGAIEATCSELREWREHYKERFIDTADPEWVLTIVDCHI